MPRFIGGAVLVLIAGAALASWPLTIDLALQPADFQIMGAAAFDQCGYALRVADVNGDGQDDLVVASCPLGGWRKGEIDVLWGPLDSSTSIIDLANPPPGAVARILGRPSDDPDFCRLAVGDVNGDQCADIAYTQPYYVFADGLAYVILGSTSFPDTLALQSAAESVVTIYGIPWWGTLMGLAVAFGDLNGDGYDEVILSAPRQEYGEIYVIHGGPTLQPTYDMAVANPGMTRIVDHRPNNWTGESLACGDVDGDGRDDLLIGSPGNVGGMRYGMATLVYGVPALPETLMLSDPSFRIKNIYGEPYSDGRLGIAVAIGNIDGDTKPDLVVSAPYADPEPCSDCGKTYILYDGDDLPDSVAVGSGAVPMTELFGEANYHGYGTTLLIGNWMGDGRDDLIVRSGGNDTNTLSRARLVFFSGTPNPPEGVLLHSDPTLTRVFEATAKDYLGADLASGDLNGDGLLDVVAGADFADLLGRSNAGTCYVLFGSGSSTAVARPEATPGLVVNATRPNPFSTYTTVEYTLSEKSDVSFIAYDVRGRRVVEMIRKGQAPGDHTISWNGRDRNGSALASGVYFYRLMAHGGTVRGKLVLVR